MDFHDSQIRVRYAETDAMGIVHHSSYIVWFEVGRTEWLEARGYSYAEFEKTGFFLVVSEIGVRYLQAARYGDTVLLRTRASEVKSRAIRFEYEVLRADTETVLVKGFSRHILTDHEGNVRTWPESMRHLTTIQN
jgi:acyl-CoA thioester hydrolase